MTRRCIDCNIDISDLHHHRKRCAKCQELYRERYMREWMQKKREKMGNQTMVKLGTTDIESHRHPDFKVEERIIRAEIRHLGLDNPTLNRRKFTSRYYWRHRYEYT